jgi:hypothetical protein
MPACDLVRDCIKIQISETDRRRAVLTSPLTVIDETLDHLQTLSEFLFDEVDERVVHYRDLTNERRLCKETLQTIRVLIPKLQAVRITGVAGGIEPPRRCANCDE